MGIPKYRTYDTSNGYGNAREWKQAFKDRMFSPSEIIEILGTEPETPYTILGLTAPASKEQIKSAWRKKVRETHPDHGGSDEAFRKVQAAFEQLYY